MNTLFSLLEETLEGEILLAPGHGTIAVRRETSEEALGDRAVVLSQTRAPKRADQPRTCTEPVADDTDTSTAKRKKKL